MNKLGLVLMFGSVLFMGRVFAQDVVTEDFIEKELVTCVENITSNRSHTDWQSILPDLSKWSGLAIAKNRGDLVIKYIGSVYTDLPDTLSETAYGQVSYYLGLAHTNAGDYVLALPYCEKANEVTDRVNPEDTLSRMKRKIILSHLYSSTEQINKAIGINEEGLSLARATKIPFSIFKFLMNGGNAFQFKGEYDLAIAYFERAYEIASGDLALLRAAKTNIGACYLESKRPDQAKIHLKEALSLLQLQKGPPDLPEAILYSDLAKGYKASEDYDSALAYIKKALKVVNDIYPEGHAFTSEFLLDMGRIQYALGDYSESEKNLRRSVRENDKYRGNLNIYSSSALETIARMKTDQPDSILFFYQRALEHVFTGYKSTSLYDMPGADAKCINAREGIDLLSHFASVLAKATKNQEQQLKRAYEVCALATELIKKFRANLNEVNSRRLFGPGFNMVISNAITIAYRLYSIDQDPVYLEQALNWMENSRGNELYLAVTLSTLQTAKQDSLFDLESRLRAEISFLERTTKSDDPASNDINAERLLTKRRALEKTINRLKAKHPEYYNAKYGGKEIILDQLQRKLLSYEAGILSFFMGQDSTYLISVSGSSVSFDQIAKTELLPQLLEDFNTSLQQRTSDHIAKGHALYQLLLENKLQAELPDQLIIIPDRKLNYLSFEALSSTIDRPSYLIQNYSITYSPSIHFFETDRPRKETDVYASVFAPGFSATFEQLATRSGEGRSLAALPYAEQEAKTVADIYNTKPYLRDRATESQFRSKAMNANIIHLATHAIIDDKDPEFSKLILSSAKDTLHDGSLHAHELYNLKINADLVGLSACNTGIGQYYEGEGVMSLARAFMYSGASTVMTSLWSVPDESTSIIMQRFYHHLDNGADKAEALKSAKLDYLAQADANTSSPYYWAGFVLIGEHPSDTSWTWNARLIIILSIGITALLIGVFYYSRAV
ncbi:CHAT domain-containing protein [Fulvivirga sp. M361]|uniref:CHAT domain-containing protein n=1 Tax=Fulvivirga sp. M361 TaxID=2594266 RepID=UPI001179A2A7|nr:CHAT domain-containing protein [Fulvivirga sp. M361]TRX60135.1 CHAT domain-containing protein [Fulvivirga sp. M361]